MFSNKQLVKLIVPLIVEQMLAVFVGMVDGIMVSAVSEQAMSGVNLVDQIGILLINIFTALAAGGAVVVAQYVGRGDKHKACRAASQLVLVCLLISTVLMAVSLLGNRLILHGIFGNISPEIMRNARTYFYITALSYPFLGVYNASAALFRSMGNSKISMMNSLFMNVMNIGGNALCIFVFHMGVEGVAIPTLISRGLAAALTTILLRNQNLTVHFLPGEFFKTDRHMVKKILSIGVPNGLESGVFQTGKLIVQRWITLFGDAAIAANSVGVSFASIQCMVPGAVGVSYITIVGQCVGAGKYQEAKKYVNKIWIVTEIAMVLVNMGMYSIRYEILGIYSNLSPDTVKYALDIFFWHSIVTILIWPISFALPNVLKAAGDVKFVVTVSMLSMWLTRVGLSYIFMVVLNMGVLGAWFGMFVDWVFRSVFFLARYISNRWYIRINKELT